MSILKNIFGSIIIEDPKKPIKELVEFCVNEIILLENANLRGADLRGADLKNANLENANLENVNLESADLRGVNLRGVNLRGAVLRSANLKNASLYNVNLINAQYSILSIFKINFGNLPDDLTLELMRHDAEFCGIDEMDAWAKGGECPYKKSDRDFLFNEKKELWKSGKPKYRGFELWKKLAEAKNIKI